MIIDPNTTTVLYAGTNGSGVFKSTDGSSSRTQVNNGLTNINVRALAIDPQNPDILYAGTWGSGVFKSKNGGLSWSSTGVTNSDVQAFAINPRFRDTIGL